MILWIILGYLVISIAVSLLFYAACIAAARADKAQQHLRATTLASEVESQPLTKVSAPRLALNA